MLGCGTRLCCLLDHPGSQAIHLLIDCLFNLGERRLRMGCSPLRNRGKGFLSLCFPTLLQVFGLHLGFSLLDSWDDSFPLRQCTISWLIPTTPLQQASGAKKCIAPIKSPYRSAWRSTSW
jgi:hypothetical protein